MNVERRKDHQTVASARNPMSAFGRKATVSGNDNERLQYPA